jgi:hypothetical protein
MSTRNNNESTTKGGTVVGLFHNQADAEHGIQRLKEAGFSESQIGVALKDRGRQQELIEGTGTQAAEGAATGAIGGGVLGGVIGLLAGVGALAIPGIGPIIAGGTLASTLAGAGIGAAAGGLLGALVGMGVPEEDAAHFDQGFRSGGTLVTVSAEGREEQARTCLSESGADLGSMGRGMRAGATMADRSPASAEKETSAGEIEPGEAHVEHAGEASIRGESSEPWRGNERRYRHDSSYSGPERRLSRV